MSGSRSRDHPSSASSVDTVNISGDVESSGVEAKASTETHSGTVIGVKNYGQAIFTYKDNATIFVHTSVSSSDRKQHLQAIVDPSSQLGPSSREQTSLAAAAIVNYGTAVVNNPTIHVKEIPSETPEDAITRILKVIHENTWQKTHVTIGETFKADKFAEPDFEIYPQMFESPHFYRGGHSDPVNEAANRQKRISVRKPEYTRDRKFIFNDFRDDEDTKTHFLSAESLMRKFHEKSEKLDVIGIVAQAGAGKTTCMRRWARHIMVDSGMTREREFRSQQERRFQMVHFIDVKYIEHSPIMSFAEVLFKGLFENENDMKVAYKWLLENQDKVVIFLDGLDQAPWAITDDDVQYLGRYGTASSPTLIYNLLSRSFIPQTRIVISSREHSATSLPEEAWINDVVTLTGFCEDDAKRLFNFVTADTDNVKSAHDNSTLMRLEHDDEPVNKPSNWDILATGSSALLPFITIPAFLMFTAIVFNTYDSAPATVTDLLAKLIETLPYSLNIKERKRIWSIINKLKRLSYMSLQKGLVIFSEDDLKDCDLETRDIRDLLLMVPRSRTLSHRLVEGDFVFFFCHQILQEFLAACTVVEMNLVDFKEFSQQLLDKEEWLVVRRFVCGLIFDATPHEQLLLIPNVYEKQEILRESLTAYLTENKAGYQRLEVYASIHESNDTVLTKSLKDILHLFFPLSQNGAQLIRSVLSKIKKLEILALQRSNLSDDLLSIMSDNLKGTVYIDCIELQENALEVSSIKKFLRNIKTRQILTNHGDLEMGNERLDFNNVLRYVIFDSTLDILLTDDSGTVTVELNNPDEEMQYSATLQEDMILSVRTDGRSCVIMQTTAHVAIYLKPKTVSLETQTKLPSQYINIQGAADIQKYLGNAVKIHEIVLNMTLHEIRDCTSQILALVRSFSVQSLHIAAYSGQEHLDDIPEGLRAELNLSGCQLTICIYDKAQETGDFDDLLFKLRSNQIGQLRLLIDYENFAGDLESFVARLENKECWIAYDEYPISASVQERLLEKAEASETILKVCHIQEWEQPWKNVFGIRKGKNN